MQNFESMNMDHKGFPIVSTTSHQIDNRVGLVCHYQLENGSSQFVFLDVKNGSGAILDNSLNFFTESFVQTLASCNGLVLLSGYSGDQACYFVINPLTKDSVMIPQAGVERQVVRVGLASDGSQFEIVVVEAGSPKSNGLEFQFHVFSSETGKWRKHHHLINLALSSLPELEFQELTTPALYSNGAIHWELGGYLLVYQIQENHCQLHEMPNVFPDWSWQSTMTYRRCLCESGGRVYYCYTDFDGFHIWDLLKEHEYRGSIYASCDFKKFRWRLVHSVMHEDFMSKHQNFFGCFYEWEPYKVAPIAYSEQAQTIYLQLPGSVVSYKFDTGNLRSMCTYSYPGMNFNCCSFLSSNASGLHNAQREKDLLTDGETELHLPLAEIATLPL